MNKDNSKNNLKVQSEAEEPKFDCMKAYKQRTWWDVITQKWVQPTFDYARTNDLKIADLGKLEETESAKYHTNLLKNSWKSYNDSEVHPLLWAVFDLYKWPVFQCVACVWFCIGLEWANAHILGQVLGYIDGESTNTTRACMFVFIMAIFELIARLGHMSCDYLQLKAANRAKIAIKGLIYWKTFRITSATNKKFKKGDINNLMGTDADRVCHLMWMIPHMLNIPPLVLACTFTLYTIVGHLCWIALAFIIVICVGFYFLNRFTTELHQKIRKDEDKRANVMSEIIDNIKVIKMNSWTQKFLDLATELRKKEYINKFIDRLLWVPHHLTHVSAYWGMVIGMFMISLYGFQIPITISSAVIMLRILGQMKGHSGALPHHISFLTEFMTSINKLERFLNCEEMETKILEKSNEQTSDFSVVIDKSNYFWGFDEPDSSDDEKDDNEDPIKSDGQVEEDLNDSVASTVSDDNSSKVQTLENKICLKNINIKIKKNEFVAVIGNIGSGKSSLLYSLLGETLHVDDSLIEQFQGVEIDEETDKDQAKEIIENIKSARRQHAEKQSAKIHIEGSISLVEQKPFILSKTLRENILFGEELEKERYNRVLDMCQLGSDLKILDGGDLTQIGEKGINLSGGQKARLSIARAVYANKDVVIMDDPMSALDAHVKKKIFDQVCCEELKDKTRILVTHAIDFLDRVDKIIVMDKGQIIHTGSYEELKDEEYFIKLMKKVHKKQNKKKEVDKKNEDDTDEIANHMSEQEAKLLDDEEDEIVEVQWKDYLAFFSFSKLSVMFSFFMVGFLMVSRALSMNQSYTTINLVQDATTEATINYGTLKLMLAYVGFDILFEISSGLLEVFQSYMLDKQMFTRMLDRVLHAPINLFFDKTPSGTILSRFTKHLDSMATHLPRHMKWSMRHSLVFITTVGFVAYNAPFCLWIIPVMLVLYYFVLGDFVNTKKQLNKIDKAIHSPITTHINESLDGTTTIRTYNKVHEFQEKQFELTDVCYSWEVIERGMNVWLCMRSIAITSIFITFSYLYFIFNKEGMNSIMVGIMMGYLTEMQWLLTCFTHDVFWVNWHMASFGKCNSMCEIKQEAGQHKPIPTDENGQPWMSKGHIKFNNYSVKYRPETETVLKNISIDIQPGQKVGVVGRTGAGKSTLCLALCRIIEKLEGSIQIDGVDIAEVGLADLRDRLTVIPQEPVLFANTLRFNLDPENKSTDEELIEMIERAGLESLLTRSSNGLNFKITEKGANLSAGEKALVCICRAALRKNKVVIMDEATASIDVNTEDTIQKLILSEFKDSTVITVAHRLNTIMHSDKILVLGHGKVVEFDSPEALKNDESSAFSSMLNEFNK